MSHRATTPVIIHGFWEIFPWNSNHPAIGVSPEMTSWVSPSIAQSQRARTRHTEELVKSLHDGWTRRPTAWTATARREAVRVIFMGDLPTKDGRFHREKKSIGLMKIPLDILGITWVSLAAGHIL